MTTDERRTVVTEARTRFGGSERRMCRFLGSERTALRYPPVRPRRDAALRARLRELAGVYPRWGVPRLHWRLQRDGERVNYKRVERLSRLENLAVRRRGRRRLAVPRVPRPVALHPNATWGIDFVSDQLADGQRVRCFTIVDHCVHEAPAILVARSLPSLVVIAALEDVIAARGQPTRISLDNGSEFRSQAFDAWAADRGIELHFIQPGKPVQNCHIESFNGRFRGVARAPVLARKGTGAYSQPSRIENPIPRGIVLLLDGVRSCARCSPRQRSRSSGSRSRRAPAPR